MIQLNCNGELLWLGHLVSESQVREIKQLKNKSKLHDSFWLPETLAGENGFKPILTVEQQAFCQVLAVEGCLVSGLLLGFSLSSFYYPSPRIRHEPSAFDYCFTYLEVFLDHHREDGFAEAAEYLQGTDVLYQICQFILENRNRLDLSYQSHRVFQFCSVLTSSIHNQICH